MMLAAVQALKKANHCVVFSGAGMSADSGIETFRSQNGFWSGLFGKCALLYGGTPLGWSLTPAFVWRYFISSFYEPIAKASPHGGYDALARLEKDLFRERFFTVTMNVDGFHQMAGADPSRVSEVHGSIRKFKCVSCSQPIAVPDPIGSRNNPPRCRCGGHVRPDVTLFYEALPSDQWILAEHAIQRLGKGDVCLVVGTSSVVYPAAGLPGMAKARGATLIEINPDENTPLSSIVDIHLKGGAETVLRELVDLVLTQ